MFKLIKLPAIRFTQCLFFVYLCAFPKKALQFLCRAVKQSPNVFRSTIANSVKYKRLSENSVFPNQSF